jgi:hypothetical protein
MDETSIKKDIAEIEDALVRLKLFDAPTKDLINCVKWLNELLEIKKKQV